VSGLSALVSYSSPTDSQTTLPTGMKLSYDEWQGRGTHL